MQYASNWGDLFADTVIVVIPTIALYALLGRRLVEGMTVGGEVPTSAMSRTHNVAPVTIYAHVCMAPSASPCSRDEEEQWLFLTGSSSPLISS